MNRCELCGLFRAWRDLFVDFTPDTAFTAERVAYRCRKCRREAEARLRQ